MDGTLEKLVIALGSLIAGHVLSRWWNRAKPVVVLRGFEEKQRTNEFVAIPDELTNLTADSWFVESVDKQASVVTLQSVYEDAKAHVDNSKDSERWCGNVKALLESAETPDKIVSAVGQLLEHEGVKDMLQAAVLFEAIRPKASFEYVGDSVITVSESEEADGSFLVVIQNRYFRLGAGLRTEGWRKTRLERLLLAIEYGDKGVILQLLNLLPSFITEQRELHRRIVEVASPIIEGKTVWVSKITIVNCGLSPMIMWPSADLIVKDPKSGARFQIPCHIAIEKDEEAAQDLIGVRVISPSETVGVWAVTTKMQDQIQSGAVLRDLYRAANVNAQVLLTITSRGWPFGSRVRSSKAVFGSFAQL